jgi:hypothetical protein
MVPLKVQFGSGERGEVRAELWICHGGSAPLGSKVKT